MMKNTKEIKEIRPEGQITYTIPPKGSLGLLAAGDKGLRAWRKVRDQEEKDKKDG